MKLRIIQKNDRSFHIERFVHRAPSTDSFWSRDLYGKQYKFATKKEAEDQMKKM